jgi:uncharacterized protein HemX
MEDTRPVCPWKLNANGFTSDVGEPPGGCRLPPGFKGWVFYESPPESPSETTTAWQEQPPRAKLRLHKEKTMSLPRLTPDVVVEPAQEVPAPVTATVGVPAVPSADDLSRIAANAGGGATGIVMALIAVVGGGGAVWKYLQSKQKAAAKKDELAHEQRMKELELQADNQKRDDDKHGECESKRAALAAKVESAESQLRLAESALSSLRDQLAAVSAKADSAVEKASSLSARASGSNEEIDERLDTFSKRISKMEAAVKAKGKK